MSNLTQARTRGKRPLASYMLAALAAAGLALTAAEASAASFGFATFSAYVHANGVTIRGSGVQTSSRPAGGTYLIEFTRPVNTCVFVATPDGTDGGQASAQVVTGNTKQIRVSTFSKTGAKVNRNFRLIVSCAS